MLLCLLPESKSSSSSSGAGGQERYGLDCSNTQMLQSCSLLPSFRAHLKARTAGKAQKGARAREKGWGVTDERAAKVRPEGGKGARKGEHKR